MQNLAVRPVTCPPRDVAALAGEEYRAAVKEAEDRPGTYAEREAALDLLLERLVGSYGDDEQDQRRFVPGPADLADARSSFGSTASRVTRRV